MTFTRDQFNSLVSTYAERLIEGMDYKTMEQFVYDTIVTNVKGMGEDEFIDEMFNYYDEEEVKQMIQSVGVDPETVL